LRQHLTARRLYVRNLNDKLPKEDLKRNLYMLFATYGVILDVVALKTAKMRGQAHVVFRDIDSSTQAMRALQGFTFFEKPMVRIRCSLSTFLDRATDRHSTLSTQRQSPTQ
jgi:RNA recognition motif-containing protein